MQLTFGFLPSPHAPALLPLWTEIEDQAQGAGHGGMDFIEDYRLIKCLREGLPTDTNVYDAAAISSVVELSVRSNARSSRPVDMPDFTRGRCPWPSQRYRTASRSSWARMRRIGRSLRGLRGRTRSARAGTRSRCSRRGARGRRGKLA